VFIGYARVSTGDQRLDVQREALTRTGCERVFEDTASGRITERPGLRGRVGGRRRLMNDSKVDAAKQLLASGMAPRVVAANLGVSVATLYRWLPASERL
jgi:DNA invertase Pin-like site-specific DNA recombinase